MRSVVAALWVFQIGPLMTNIRRAPSDCSELIYPYSLHFQRVTPLDRTLGVLRSVQFLGLLCLWFSSCCRRKNNPAKLFMSKKLLLLQLHPLKTNISVDKTPRQGATVACNIHKFSQMHLVSRMPKTISTRPFRAESPKTGVPSPNNRPIVWLTAVP